MQSDRVVFQSIKLSIPSTSLATRVSIFASVSMGGSVVFGLGSLSASSGRVDLMYSAALRAW